jgi:hypothetical protein
VRGVDPEFPYCPLLRVEREFGADLDDAHRESEKSPQELGDRIFGEIAAAVRRLLCRRDRLADRARLHAQPCSAAGNAGA